MMITADPFDTVDLRQQELDEIKEAFDLFDQDGSGTISIDELLAKLVQLGFDKKSTEGVNRIMSKIDKDGSNVISRDEFFNLMSRKLGKDDSDAEIMNVYKLFDAQQIGRIYFDDLVRVSRLLGETVKESTLKDMIKTFSKTKDGQDKLYITKDEFFAMMREDLD